MLLNTCGWQNRQLRRCKERIKKQKIEYEETANSDAAAYNRKLLRTIYSVFDDEELSKMANTAAQIILMSEER